MEVRARGVLPFVALPLVAMVQDEHHEVRIEPLSYDGWLQSTALPYFGRLEGIKRKLVWGHRDRKRASKDFSPGEDPCVGAA